MLILEARDLNHAIQLMSQHPGMKRDLGPNEDSAACGFERNHKGERAAAAKGYPAMRAGTRDRMIRIADIRGYHNSHHNRGFWAGPLALNY
jgi:hypothetical protein